MGFEAFLYVVGFPNTPKIEPRNAKEPSARCQRCRALAKAMGSWVAHAPKAAPDSQDPDQFCKIRRIASKLRMRCSSRTEILPL